MIKLFYATLAIVILSGCTTHGGRPQSSLDAKESVVKQMNNSPSGKAAWQKWVNRYDEDRRSKTGWLSLAGLYWLREGSNTIGSNKSNDHQLPAGMLGQFGKIDVAGDTVSFTSFDDEILIDGKKLNNQLLVVNESKVSYKSFVFYIIKREKGYAIRLQNSENPRVAHYAGTHFFPYSEQAAIPARLIRNKTPRKLKISTVYGTVRDAESAGILEFTYKGKNLSLEAVSYGKDNPMDLMFVDETGQETTYGAGRYLDVDWPIQGDMTIINFNYAYNPPCAITEFATCPLPPRQNRLDVAINAGELFSGH